MVAFFYGFLRGNLYHGYPKNCQYHLDIFVIFGIIEGETPNEGEWGISQFCFFHFEGTFISWIPKIVIKFFFSLWHVCRSTWMICFSKPFQLEPVLLCSLFVLSCVEDIRIRNIIYVPTWKMDPLLQENVFVVFTKVIFRISASRIVYTTWSECTVNEWCVVCGLKHYSGVKSMIFQRQELPGHFDDVNIVVCINWLFIPKDWEDHSGPT